MEHAIGRTHGSLLLPSYPFLPTGWGKVEACDHVNGPYVRCPLMRNLAGRTEKARLGIRPCTLNLYASFLPNPSVKCLNQWINSSEADQFHMNVCFSCQCCGIGWGHSVRTYIYIYIFGKRLFLKSHCEISFSHGCHFQPFR